MSITFSAIDYVIIFLVAVTVVIILIFSLIRKMRRSQFDAFSRDKIMREWQGIEDLVKKDSTTAWKLAVLEADKLFDYTLKSLAIPGKDLGERIRFMSYKHPVVREVWPAHKVRNRLVHETDYHLDKKTAYFVVARFKKILKLLGAL